MQKRPDGGHSLECDVLPQFARIRQMWCLTMKQKSVCELCGRQMQAGTTEHHLIPRTCHSNKWFKKQFTREQMQKTVSLCRDCHNTIHRFIPREKQLGRHFHTLELLRSHPQIARYIGWIRKQR